MSLFASRQFPVWIFVALAAVALTFGVRTTRGLDWPGIDWHGVGIDLYRDISSAQTMLNTGYGPDPTYLGERTWYNPLTPSITAAVSALSGWPVHLVATRIGTYANLLAPICFFLMCAALFDRWTALFATAGFLFLLPGSLPSWVSATYSPWFLPVSFVQTVFYLTVLALYRAHRDGRLFAYLGPGILWGLTFLGHTGPALVLGVMVTIWLALVIWTDRRAGAAGTRKPQTGPALRRYGLMVVAALVVSSPLIAIIVGHYGLRTKNAVPSAYSDPWLSRDLPRLIWLHVSIPMALAVVGLIALVRRPSQRIARLLILSWIASAGLFLAYSYVRLAVRAVHLSLPSIVPSFHFFFYLKAAAAVLFGVGLMTVGRAVAAWLAARRLQQAGGGASANASARPRLSRATIFTGRAVAAAGCLVLLIAQAPTYRARDDFEPARRDALKVAGSDQVRTFEWLQANLGPTDVVLTADDDAATIVAPSGAKVVSIFTGFSNPYVDFEARHAARDLMFEALDRGDSAMFRNLAVIYRVGWVLTRSERSERFDANPPPDLELAFTTGDRRVYRFRLLRIWLAD